jgi:hypothetical protein
MNGRMYDPMLGRMLSPDNYVPDVTDSQSFNRYSYVFNNPLKFVDPSGEIPIGLVLLIAAAVSVTVNGIRNYSNNRPFFEGAYEAAMMGLFMGAGAYAIGGFSAMYFSGADQVFMQTLSHGLLAGASTVATQGGGFEAGFASGFIGSLIAGTTMSIFQNSKSSFLVGFATVGSGSVSAGISAEIAGGDFWEGFKYGAISSSLNHLAHRGIDGLATKKKGEYKILFDGEKLTVTDKNGKVVYSHAATSGSGEHMNNPDSQHIGFLGPIPEGEYIFSGKDWNFVSPLRQLYNIIVGNGDWGYYNVKLTPLTYRGDRFNFFLHGGSYPGSAGCIDAGCGVTDIYRLTLDQSKVHVTVKYK